MRRSVFGGLAVAALVLGVLPVTPAGAATGTDYGSWTISGAGTAYTGTVDPAIGFPATTWTSDSRTPPAPAIATGTSVWIPAGTPFGARFGSSQDQPYLNLRPRADNAASPSTTTYTFATPTPVGTWGVVLGDIDAETLTVSATTTGGAAVSGADLGVQAFSYCDASPRSSSCGGLTAPYAEPTVTTAATSVSATDPLCPTVDPTRCNTQGASVLLDPAVPLTSLTVVSTWKQGLPTYQTWFATLRGEVNGLVTSDCPVTAPVGVRLLDAAGTPVLGISVLPDQSYSLPALAQGVAYTASVDPASLPAGVTAADVAVPVLGATATAPNLALVSTFAVVGTLSGQDVAGVPVTLTPAGGTAVQTVTDADGGYRFDGVALGDYTVTVAADRVVPARRTVTVGCADVEVATFERSAAPDDPGAPAPGIPGTPPGQGGTIPPSVTGPLAATGADPFPLLQLGSALLASGGALVVLGRRRSARRS